VGALIAGGLVGVFEVMLDDRTIQRAAVFGGSFGAALLLAIAWSCVGLERERGKRLLIDSHGLFFEQTQDSTEGSNDET